MRASFPSSPSSPAPDALRQILETARTVAVVGAKDTPGQPADRVGRFLVNAGYTVFPVHPVHKNIWGLTTYEKLADIPADIDVVNLFRAPAHCPGHAGEVLDLITLPKLFWMQLGVQSPQAALLLAENGITVVEDACLMTEHARMFGGSIIL